MVDIIYPLFLFNLIILVDCEMEPFIVNGEKATIRKFPHAALMNINCVEKNVMKPWICGASILTSTITLTAAQCLIGCDTHSTVSVRVGSRYKKRGELHSVKSFIRHEMYSAEVFAYDIALMLLYTPLIFGTWVKRVAVMPNPPTREEITAQVAGWGENIDILNDIGSNLMYIDQIIWLNAACKAVHYRLPNGTICGTSRNIDSTVSSGDSGSALVVRGYIQIGIVSYKVPSVSKSLVVYTDTGYFYDWITKTTKKLYCAN